MKYNRFGDFIQNNILKYGNTRQLKNYVNNL